MAINSIDYCRIFVNIFRTRIGRLPIFWTDFCFLSVCCLIPHASAGSNGGSIPGRLAARIARVVMATTSRRSEFTHRSGCLPPRPAGLQWDEPSAALRCRASSGGRLSSNAPSCRPAPGPQDTHGVWVMRPPSGKTLTLGTRCRGLLSTHCGHSHRIPAPPNLMRSAPSLLSVLFRFLPFVAK
jgi:hypothetical protein